MRSNVRPGNVFFLLLSISTGQACEPVAYYVRSRLGVDKPYQIYLAGLSSELAEKTIKQKPQNQHHKTKVVDSRAHQVN